jgi:glycosyltransferase involved in cell wall biosynthesis
MTPWAATMPDSGAPRLAIVHDWLTGMRGGEKVLEAVCAIYPQADLFTLLHVPGSVSPAIERHRIRTSFIQRLPWASRLYRHYLPLFPAAVESFNLDGYEAVISVSHCAAKAVLVTPPRRHLCYCLTPMRYAWDQFDAYFGTERVGRVGSALLRPILASLARWDAATADRAGAYVGISRYVARRIARYYSREARVVYPPVDTAFFTPADVHRQGHALVVSALVPYKRVDVAITACRLAGVPVRVVGDGPELSSLQTLADASVTFLGRLPDEEVRREYRQAATVLLPGIEDFGIVPLEAQACGTPVVALADGGALETVVDGVTGALVRDAGAEAFAEGILRVIAGPVDSAAVRRHAERFGRERFDAEFRAVVDESFASA